MKKQLKVFVDSDVIISSLISKSGAAYLLIHKTDLLLFISHISYKELKTVVERLKLDKKVLEKVIKNKFKMTKLPMSLFVIKERFKDYILDINDSHVIAGACQSKAKYLISYNLKHYKTDKIKSDFDILTTTPARFLQYLRSS